MIQPDKVVRLYIQMAIGHLTLLYYKLEYGLMPNVMAALPNVGGALCSTPQTLADAHYSSAVQ